MRPLRKGYVQDPGKMFKDGNGTKRSKAMGYTCGGELGLSLSETKVNSNKSTMEFVGFFWCSKRQSLSTGLAQIMC